MMKKEIEKKLIKLFHSNIPLYNISLELEINQSTIRKFWRELFGNEAVGSRYLRVSKKRHTDLNKDLIIKDYYTGFSMAVLSKKYNTDYRKIREIWIKEFGKDCVRNRKVHNKSSVVYKKDLINKVHDLVFNGMSVVEISEFLNISKSTTAKYISLDGEAYERSRKISKGNRSKLMVKIREKDRLKNNTIEAVSEMFYTNLFPYEIAEMFSICRNSVSNIFKDNFSEEECKERNKRMKKRRIKKVYSELRKAGKLGSKPENRFFKELNKRISTRVVHHDLSVIPPYEVDITIPSLKIAICWDGIFHFKPIYSKKSYNKIRNRDKYKRRFFKRSGWFAFIVVDKEAKMRDEFFVKQHKRFDRFMNKLGYGNFIGEEYVPENFR